MCAMIIGLKSGYQFVVKNKFYMFAKAGTDLLTHVFISEDGKRLVTIPPKGSIEFIDEPAKEDTVKKLEQTVADLTSNEIMEEVEPDPNVG